MLLEGRLSCTSRDRGSEIPCMRGGCHACRIDGAGCYAWRMSRDRGSGIPLWELDSDGGISEL